MTTFFKSIKEALPIQRPGDIIRKEINNKFAFVDIINTDGTFTKNKLMGLDNNIIYSYDINWPWIMECPNIERVGMCYNHSANGLPYHYITKITDNRRLKQIGRKLKKLNVI